MPLLPDDQLWPEFQLLWTLMRAAGSGLLVAGGYGLFLKQHWLKIDRGNPTIIPLERWGDQTPRITKDLDLVVSLSSAMASPPG